jgi:Raf kinase inhibitor-like YbhB/YbcL family protein
MSNPRRFFPRTLAALIILSIELQAVALAQSQMALSSSSIAPGAAITDDFACTGADRSPELVWSGAPKSAVTFAMIVEDPDAPNGTFTHWVAYNIPASRTSLPSGVPRTAEIPGGGTNGMNSFGNIGYNGPCPPPGKIHHYRFHLFALNSALSVGEQADAAAVEAAIAGHVVAEAELIGTFKR